MYALMSCLSSVSVFGSSWSFSSAICLEIPSSSAATADSLSFFSVLESAKGHIIMFQFSRVKIRYKRVELSMPTK